MIEFKFTMEEWETMYSSLDFVPAECAACQRCCRLGDFGGQKTLNLFQLLNEDEFHLHKFGKPFEKTCQGYPHCHGCVRPAMCRLFPIYVEEKDGMLKVFAIRHLLYPGGELWKCPAKYSPEIIKKMVPGLKLLLKVPNTVFKQFCELIDTKVELELIHEELLCATK